MKIYFVSYRTFIGLYEAVVVAEDKNDAAELFKKRFDDFKEIDNNEFTILSESEIKSTIVRKVLISDYPRPD